MCLDLLDWLVVVVLCYCMVFLRCGVWFYLLWVDSWIALWLVCVTLSFGCVYIDFDWSVLMVWSLRIASGLTVRWV